MGVGIGGLITQMMQGDPSQQLAQQLAGPHPDPMAQPQGGPPAAGGAPQGQPQAPALPPAQAYAPDPANASVMSALLKVHQQDMASNSINQNINRMAAGFGTAQQQHDKMAAIGVGGDGGDTLGALGQIQRLQSNQMELENKQRFQASAEMLGQTFGLKKGQGGMLSSDPELFNSIIGTKVRDMSPTELQKNIEAYKVQAHAAGIPEDQIQEAVQMAFTQSITPGQTSDEKNMMRDIQLFRKDHPGEPLPEELRSVAGYAASKADAVKTSVEAGKIRVENSRALPEIESGLKPIMDNLDRLLADPDHAVTAIQLPDQATSGVGGYLGGKFGAIDPKTLSAKQDITQLKGLLSGDVMKTQKNIRTQREFNSVTSGASPIFDAATPPEKIKQGLKELRDKFNLLRENAKAAAGHEVSPEYADRVDKDYFDKDSPLYNGATKPSGGGRPMPADDLEEARALIAQGADPEKVKAHIRSKGFIVPPGL